MKTTNWREKAESDQVMFVRDINDTDELTLVTDAMEIDEIGDYLGIDDLSDEIGCVFVEVVDGDYGYVFGVMSSIPALNAQLYDLDRWFETWRWKLEQQYNDESELESRDFGPDDIGLRAPCDSYWEA